MRSSHIASEFGADFEPLKYYPIMGQGQWSERQAFFGETTTGFARPRRRTGPAPARKTLTTVKRCMILKDAGLAALVDRISVRLLARKKEIR